LPTVHRRARVSRRHPGAAAMRRGIFQRRTGRIRVHTVRGWALQHHRGSNERCSVRVVWGRHVLPRKLLGARSVSHGLLLSR
jgi:hypothetical protein